MSRPDEDRDSRMVQPVYLDIAGVISPLPRFDVDVAHVQDRRHDPKHQRLMFTAHALTQKARHQAKWRRQASLRTGLVVALLTKQ